MELTPEQALLAKQVAGASLARRTVYITGQVDSAMAHKVVMTLEELDATEGDIRVVLNSEGGSEPDGYAIYDAITRCRNRVVIDGMGSVMSISAIIFQAGDLRRIAINAEFMIHNGSIETDDTIQQNDVIDLAEQIKKGNERYYLILMEGSQQPRETIEEWCRAETFFNAHDTVAAGFADEVIEPIKSRVPKKPTKRKRK